MNRTKLRNILKALDPMKVDFQSFDNELAKLKAKLQETIVVKTLEDVNVALEKTRKQLNFEPLTSAFESLKEDIAIQNSDLLEILDSKQTKLASLIKDSEITNAAEIAQLNTEIAILSARKIEIPDFGKQIKNTESKLIAMIETAKTLDTLEYEKEKEEIQAQFAAFEKQIKELKQAFSNRGGGSMNRQIFIGGADPLKRYTDINLKAGSNVTITYQNNDTTKKVDITLSSSGGGGSVGGTVRQIQTLTVSSAIGSLTGTDQVYLANGGLQITLPDATNSDTNLYTIKNTGNSSVLINTISAQTIDGQATIIMPIQYTSVDIVSDSTNWEIT